MATGDCFSIARGAALGHAERTKVCEARNMMYGWVCVTDHNSKFNYPNNEMKLGYQSPVAEIDKEKMVNIN
jgi:hypothetical protein